MLGYLNKALKYFLHKMPSKKKDSLYLFTPSKYGTKTWYAEEAIIPPKESKQYIQEVKVNFLYYR